MCDFVTRGTFDLDGSSRASLLCGASAVGSLRHEVLLCIEGLIALRSGNGLPGALRAQLTRLHVVAQLIGHVVAHHGATRGVENGIGDFHTVLGVARHHVGARQVDGVGVLTEGVHARVLQEATHDRADVHVLGAALDARQHAGYPAG